MDDWQLPKVKPNHLDLPLVAGCSTGHIPRPVHMLDFNELFDAIKWAETWGWLRIGGAHVWTGPRYCGSVPQSLLHRLWLKSKAGDGGTRIRDILASLLYNGGDASSIFIYSHRSSLFAVYESDTLSVTNKLLHTGVFKSKSSSSEKCSTVRKLFVRSFSFNWANFK